VIRLRSVDKEYDGRKVLRNLDLQVDAGEFLFVTGPSGAGKTTLLRLLYAAERPTAGEVWVGGERVDNIARARLPGLRRKVGVIFQDFKLLPERTIGENVALPLEVRSLPRREIRRKVQGLLRSVGLEHRAEKFPPSLSGGEQQRVAVARALAADPALLLADEPTGNLDADRTLEVMELLAAANARGTTVVIATHDRSLLQRYTRRVVALERGRLVSDGDSIRQAGGG